MPNAQLVTFSSLASTFGFCSAIRNFSLTRQLRDSPWMTQDVVFEGTPFREERVHPSRTYKRSMWKNRLPVRIAAGAEKMAKDFTMFCSQ